MKYLIINADDFGYSDIFNAKILELLERSLVSSTTVMVNRITDEQTKQIKKLLELKKSQNISIGLHLEFSDENFKPEIEKQYAKFVSIFGFDPSHIDIHKSTFLRESFPIVIQFCKEKHLPCRNHNIVDVDVVKTKNEVMSGTKMSFEELKKTLESFKDNETYEIFFHPGMYDLGCKSSLNKERELDTKKIEEIYPVIKENNIQLISYLNLAALSSHENNLHIKQ